MKTEFLHLIRVLNIHTIGMMVINGAPGGKEADIIDVIDLTIVRPNFTDEMGKQLVPKSNSKLSLVN